MSVPKSLFFLLVSALLMVACSAPVHVDREVRDPSVSRHLAGSCAEDLACGDQSSGACWCDDLCVFYGDCCTDAAEVCGVDECDPVSGSGCHDDEVCVDGPPADCQPADPCSAQDASSEGMCMAFWGYAWDGTRCNGLSGCSCEGADCDTLPMEIEECEAAFTECPTCLDASDPTVHHVTQDPAMCQVIRFTCEPGQEMFSDACGCGCVDGPPEPTCTDNAECGDDAFCALGGTCGDDGAPGECVVRPEACIMVYDPVCGCDGRTYGNACMAANSGMNVASTGACAPAGDSCEDRCGDESADGSCYCDDWCDFFGDCCDDIAQYCD